VELWGQTGFLELWSQTRFRNSGADQVSGFLELWDQTCFGGTLDQGENRCQGENRYQFFFPGIPGKTGVRVVFPESRGKTVSVWKTDVSSYSRASKTGIRTRS
jgi:hypothetical protein